MVPFYTKRRVYDQRHLNWEEPILLVTFDILSRFARACRRDETKYEISLTEQLDETMRIHS